MISVVIPVYNAEKYIGRCLDSLIAQSYGNWEAICIDDGSTDSSPSILNSYAERDSRIKVLHIANQGVSNARNVALEHAEGEFMLFVDSDDFIHPQTMEICHKLIVEKEADLVAFTYDRKYRALNMLRQILHLGEKDGCRFTVYDESAIEYFITDDILSCSTENDKPDGIDDRWVVKHCQPWRCMYRSSKIRDISFVKGIIYEDFPWWSEVMLRTEKAVIINLPLYFYYPNMSSYVNSAKQQYRIDSLRLAIAEAEKVYSKADTAKRQKWERYFLKAFKSKLAKKEKRYGKNHLG